METFACNCIVCAKEFEDKQESFRLDMGQYKICQACLDRCDPENDYQIAKNIVSCYIKFAEAKSSLKEVKSLLKS